MSREYPQAPMVGVGVVLVRGETVLLIKRGRQPAAGAWSLPGGGQELGETAEAAARRELLEETGLTAGKLTLIAHVDSIHRDATGRIQYHYTILDFAALYEGGQTRAGDDATEFAWVHSNDFDRYDVSCEARRVIGDAIVQMNKPP